jgi:hypothetical protein
MDEILSLVSPGMQDCYPDEGFIKMEASAEAGQEPTNALLKFAKVVLTPIDGSKATSSPLTFYGIGKETNIYTLENGEEVSILDKDALSSLLVNLLKQEGDNQDDSQDSSSSSDLSDSSDSSQSSDANNSSESSDASESSETSSTSTTSNSPKENGEQCKKDKECISGICEQNICTAGTNNKPDVTNSEWLSITPTRLRATSEGTAAMLAWDPIAVAGVKGYNLYYGETSGTYLHRRTISAQDNTHIVRNLPLGHKFYFALRAVNSSGDETSFSQEVSVVIGDPNSSSAPLVLNVGVTGNDPAPSNPIQASLTQNGTTTMVPGETGLASTALWLVFIGAIAGTLIALRRQFTS